MSIYGTKLAYFMFNGLCIFYTKGNHVKTSFHLLNLFLFYPDKVYMLYLKSNTVELQWLKY